MSIHSCGLETTLPFFPGGLRSTHTASILLLDQAMHDGFNAADASLERFREYLRRLARKQLGGAYITKLDPSDLVQQTLLDAYKKLGQFQGSTERERAAWLREIFSNNLADVFRALNRQKRDIRRERSSSRLAAWLEDLPAPPSDETAENDELLRLAWALSELPELQHAVIEFHHLQGLSLAETADRLGRSQASIAGLARRGIARLRELLDDPNCDTQAP